jgi:hypothetical protein
MRWAIIDENRRVLSIVEQEERPENGVKAFDPSAAVGRYWNGWTFDAPRWTAYQFLLRFTAAERASFRAAAATDENVADFQELATAAQEIVADDPMTVAGIDYLVSINLLTQARANEILGG